MGVVGGDGSRLARTWSTGDLFQPSVGAFAVGMAHPALDASVAHARERRQFGKPLAEHQAVAHLLADMAMRTEAARLLVHAAVSGSW